MNLKEEIRKTQELQFDVNLTPKKEHLNLMTEKTLNQEETRENYSDGYHTFKELYEFRKVYNAALFNEWAKLYSDYDVHKSWKHNDGELCFGGGWFVVVAILPTGQISNHYKAEDWDLFKIPEVDKAKYEFDGHTSSDVVFRLNSYIRMTEEDRLGVNLTPKKELETKKDFSETLYNFKKSLEKFNLGFEGVDEDDEFQVEIIESNNNAIDEIKSLLSEIMGKLRLIEYLY
jgi:hypothetical protein